MSGLQDDDIGMQRAFPLREPVDWDSHKSFDPSVPPMSAEEYLLRVRYEASNMPDVVVADVARSEVKSSILGTQYSHVIEEDILALPHHLQPPDSWIQNVVATFADLRVQMSHMETIPKQNWPDISQQSFSYPRLHDWNRWYTVFTGEDLQETIAKHDALVLDTQVHDYDDFNDASVQGQQNRGTINSDNRPKSQAESTGDCNKQICANDPNGTMHLNASDRCIDAKESNRNNHLLESDKTIHENNKNKNRAIVPIVQRLLRFDQAMTRRLVLNIANHLESLPFAWTPSMMVWIYGLMAHIDKPLQKNVASALRVILRWAALMVNENGEILAKTNALSTVQIVYYIIAQYFKQLC